MKGYETVIILHPDLTEEEVQGTTERFSGVITEQGGEVRKSDIWGLRKLAYKVKGHVKGNFVWLLFTGTPPTIAELERNLRISEQSIRFMTVRVEDMDAAEKIRPHLLDDPTLSIREGYNGRF
ncbi:MAG: 30S ribosomal protein S6 [Deltaproteobacteria bacterium]|nr:30S ribosomal protein S6 [Deltaproteobacteria bacterium]